LNEWVTRQMKSYSPAKVKLGLGGAKQFSLCD
jgi:hypothetical protein